LLAFGIQQAQMCVVAGRNRLAGGAGLLDAGLEAGDLLLRAFSFVKWPYTAGW